MSAHTPGPWAIHRDYVVSDDGGAICEWGKWSTKADASLIAACPDLLAALEQIANDGYDAATCEEIARAAIAKAKGEA